MVIRRITVFFLLSVAAAIFLSGCMGIPLPPLPGIKKKQNATWKVRHFPIQQLGATQFVIKSKEDLGGTMTLDENLYDGFVWGNLRFQPRHGKVISHPQCWLGRLIDACEIHWPNGESWVIFAWDHGKSARLRTISLFDPRSGELFKMGIEFGKNFTPARMNSPNPPLVSPQLGAYPPKSPGPGQVGSNSTRFEDRSHETTAGSIVQMLKGETKNHLPAADGTLLGGNRASGSFDLENSSGEVLFQYSWNLTMAGNEKYLAFLKKIGLQYGDATTWNSPNFVRRSRLSSTDGARARNRPDGKAFSGLSPKIASAALKLDGAGFMTIVDTPDLLE